MEVFLPYPEGTRCLLLLNVSELPCGDQLHGGRFSCSATKYARAKPKVNSSLRPMPLFSRATYSNCGLLTILLCARSPVFAVSDASLCMSRKKVVFSSCIILRPLPALGKRTDDDLC